jgi:antitoxin component YwqK of YwqJK toxin-antitoxin module
MKLKFSSIIACFFFVALSATAQDSIYYYDNNNKPSNPEAAAIISIARKEDSGWMRMDYYTYSKKVSKVGHYKDHDFKIKNGSFTSYFANEQLHSTGDYKDGLLIGLHVSFYPDGMMMDSCKFTNNIPTGNCSFWYPDGSIKQVFQMDTLGDGSGVIVGYFPNGVVSYKGKVLKGMRKTGAWTYYHENGNKASILKFPTIDETTLSQVPELKLDTLEGARYDSLVEYSSAICFNEDGIEQAGCEFKNKLSEFNGGQKQWTSYLTRKLYGVADNYLKDNRSIIYEVYFTTTTEGKVSDVLLTNKIDPGLDKIISNIFNGSTKWASSMHNNRKIPFMHKQAIVLSAVNAMDPITNMKPVKVTTTIERRSSGGNPLNRNQFQ